MLKFLFGILLFITFSCSIKTYKLPPCIERRSVIEMGSSRIKLTIADIDSCKEKYFQTVARKDWVVNQNRSDEAKKYTIIAITEATNTISEYPETGSPLVIATGVYREIKDLNSLFEQVKKITKSRPRVLTALEESKLGIKSLLATETHLPKQFIVWDIGGNSMHLTLVENGRNNYFFGKGSEYYKTLSLNILKRSGTPNPIGKKKIGILKKEFIKDALPYFSSFPKNQSLTVYGIGAVHSESILHKIQDSDSKIYDEYRLRDLNGITLKFSILTDEQIAGEYASNQVTNQILVESMMEYLKFSKVSVRSLDLTQGAMTFGFDKLEE